MNPSSALWYKVSPCKYLGTFSEDTNGGYLVWGGGGGGGGGEAQQKNNNHKHPLVYILSFLCQNV